MKFSMAKAGLTLLYFTFILSCKQKPTDPPPDPNPTTASAEKLACDSILKALKSLTDYNPEKHSLTKIKREIEINNWNDVADITDTFYLYAKDKLKIDTSITSDPRLSLGVDFNGESLLEWMVKVRTERGATKIKVQFGVYTTKFLGGYLSGSSNAQERRSRARRLTAILVAYKTVTKTNADGTKTDEDEFVGGYNLGGMQP
jgi:hypothetical protein